MKKKKRGRLITLGLFMSMLFLCFLGIAREASCIGGFDINGFLRLRSAVRTHSPNDVMKMESTFQTQIDKRFTDKLSARVILRYFYDSVFDIDKDHGYGAVHNARQNLQDTWSLAYHDFVREAFLDYQPRKDTFFRIGKQIVVWGKTDGFRLLDVVNPIDYRDWTIPEWEDKLIPLWMVRAEFNPTRSSNFQVLWIPEYQPTTVPYPFTPMSFRAIDIFQQLANDLHFDYYPNLYDDANKPALTMENSSVGVKWYQQIGQLGYSLNYMYKWTDVPHVKPQIHDGVFRYNQTPDRVNLFGGSFDYNFNCLLGLEQLVFRGEFAYYLNDTVYGAARPDWSVDYQKDRFDFVLGLDKYFFVDYWVSLQYFCQTICDWKKNDALTNIALGYVDPVENALTLFVMKDYFQEKINVEALYYWHDDGDMWLRPRVKWEAIGSKLWVILGGNMFWGHKTTFAGEHSQNDQVTLELKYMFSL